MKFSSGIFATTVAGVTVNGVTATTSCGPDFSAFTSAIPELESAFGNSGNCAHLKEGVEAIAACVEGDWAKCFSKVTAVIPNGGAIISCLMSPEASACGIIDKTDLYKEAIPCQKTLADYLSQPFCASSSSPTCSIAEDLFNNISFLNKNTVSGVASSVCAAPTAARLEGLDELVQMTTPKSDTGLTSPTHQLQEEPSSCGTTLNDYISAGPTIKDALDQDGQCLQIASAITTITYCMQENYVMCGVGLVTLASDIPSIIACAGKLKPNTCQAIKSTTLYTKASTCEESIGDYLKPVVCTVSKTGLCPMLDTAPEMKTPLKDVAADICPGNRLR